MSQKTPHYMRVYTSIKRGIMEGEYPIGSLLPPEPQLEKQFDVSRTTVRRAIDLLSREGFVFARQGYGTEVLDYKTQQNLNLVTSISETLKQKGYAVQPKSMHIDIIEAPPGIAQKLEIRPGEPVARVQRIQLADNAPIAIMKNHIPLSMVPGIETHVNTFTSLYTFLEEHYNLQIDSGHQKISARCASFAEAEMLHIPVGAPLLHTRRVCYFHGHPVCYDSILLVGDRFEMEIHMSGRYRDD